MSDNITTALEQELLDAASSIPEEDLNKFVNDKDSAAPRSMKDMLSGLSSYLLGATGKFFQGPEAKQWLGTIQTVSAQEVQRRLGGALLKQFWVGIEQLTGNNKDNKMIHALFYTKAGRTAVIAAVGTIAAHSCLMVANRYEERLAAGERSRMVITNAKFMRGAAKVLACMVIAEVGSALDVERLLDAGVSKVISFFQKAGVSTEDVAMLATSEEGSK
jgi:hypothetical protein